MTTQSIWRRYHAALLIAFLAVFVAGCAAGDARFTTESLAGFWQGCWHGLIAPFTFLIGLFKDNVEIYERFNNGAWYDFGFILGIGFLFGSREFNRRARAFNDSVAAKNAAGE